MQQYSHAAMAPTRRGQQQWSLFHGGTVSFALCVARGHGGRGRCWWSVQICGVWRCYLARRQCLWCLNLSLELERCIPLHAELLIGRQRLPGRIGPGCERGWACTGVLSLLRSLGKLGIEDAPTLHFHVAVGVLGVVEVSAWGLELLAGPRSIEGRHIAGAGTACASCKLLLTIQLLLAC